MCLKGILVSPRMVEDHSCLALQAALRLAILGPAAATAAGAGTPGGGGLPAAAGGYFPPAAVAAAEERAEAAADGEAPANDRV